MNNTAIAQSGVRSSNPDVTTEDLQTFDSRLLEVMPQLQRAVPALQLLEQCEQDCTQELRKSISNYARATQRGFREAWYQDTDIEHEPLDRIEARFATFKAEMAGHLESLKEALSDIQRLTGAYEGVGLANTSFGTTITRFEEEFKQCLDRLDDKKLVTPLDRYANGQIQYWIEEVGIRIVHATESELQRVRRGIQEYVQEELLQMVDSFGESGKDLNATLKLIHSRAPSIGTQRLQGLPAETVRELEYHWDKTNRICNEIRRLGEYSDDKLTADSLQNGLVEIAQLHAATSYSLDLLNIAYPERDWSAESKVLSLAIASTNRFVYGERLWPQYEVSMPVTDELEAVMDFRRECFERVVGQVFEDLRNGVDKSDALSLLGSFGMEALPVMKQLMGTRYKAEVLHQLVEFLDGEQACDRQPRMDRPDAESDHREQLKEVLMGELRELAHRFRDDAQYDVFAAQDDAALSAVAEGIIGLATLEGTLSAEADTLICELCEGQQIGRNIFVHRLRGLHGELLRRGVAAEAQPVAVRRQPEFHEMDVPKRIPLQIRAIEIRDWPSA